MPFTYASIQIKVGRGRRTGVRARAFLALTVALGLALGARSAPAADKELRFFVVSDFGRNGHHNQKKVAGAMARAARAAHPKFILTAGDNFQINGVQSVTDPLWMTTFESIYSTPELLVDWYPVLGNHDYRGNTQAELDYTQVSRRWRMLGRYYTFTKPVGDSDSLRVICLDTTPLVTESDRDAEDGSGLDSQSAERQLAWLEQTLAESHETWKVVIGHHPVFSSGSLHGDNRQLIERLKPLFDRYDVDFYIAGHDHHFEHIKPREGRTDYVIAGTGSAVRPCGKGRLTQFSRSVPGFAMATVTQGTFTIRFVDVQGAVLYSTTKTRR